MATPSEELKALRQKAAANKPKEEPRTRGQATIARLQKQVPHVTTGPVGRDSAGYSILKAAAFSLGLLPPDQAKEEIETHNRLKELYGYYSGWQSGAKSFLIPIGTRFLPLAYAPDTLEVDPDKVKFASVLRQKLAASQAGGLDPDEYESLRKKGVVSKALGTVDDTAGGSIVGFPSLGEVIDLQRNREVFVNAGASEIALPPNGRISFPKLTGGATAYMVGEALPITSSQPSTGSLLLEAKKLAIRVPINNELFRFANPTTEALVRTDMAKQAALKADQEMLEGTGGVRLKGLITYDGQTAWSQGSDRLITHVAFTTGANGDTFQPEDVALMEGKLPDPVDAPTAWVMRRTQFARLKNRRSDAVSAADGKGVWLFDITRNLAEGKVVQLHGTRVVQSNQVSNTRVKGSGVDLTYILLGYFPDWLIGRFGVMEVLANPWESAAWANDQTELRGIQHLDAGPRHSASFVLCDQLLQV